MPRPKVYREYFPSCIERFFGSGKPRRIKARCFVPYTQQEQNTDVYLGPSRDAPNIDLNMTVRKDKYGNLTCSPEGEAIGNYGPCNEGGQQMWSEDPCNQNRPCGPCAPCAPSVASRRLDCGCSCRCTESCNSSSSCSSTRTSTTKSKSKCKNGKPKILVLENDGRYRPVGEEFLQLPGTPKRGFKKSRSKSDKTSLPKPKLVVKEKKVEVLEQTEDEVSILPAECGLDICTKDKSKNGVVLGYVMYDPESEDKRPYVTTMDGKRITQDKR